MDKAVDFHHTWTCRCRRGKMLQRLLLLCWASVCVCERNREYFLRIEEVSWNYAPTGMNVIHNRTLDNDE